MAKQTKNTSSDKDQAEGKPAVAEPGENGQTTVAPAPQKDEMVHLIVFKLGAEYYAIKIEQVKEVTITPAITRMPRTPGFIKGVTNIRGDIIAIMDLETRFQIRPASLPPDANPNVTYTLVIEAKDYSIGVEVREMPQSLNLPVSRIDRAPSFLQDINIQENFIEGIAKIEDRLIIVLDMHRILSQEEINQLPNA
ncbi:purine-binding chemotaxis protein CheW [Pontibacter ummariensis]|uniref:CheW protein n=1 Tax=Pontibacter ummariensis TaxID=1610492 RepID=A0A239C9P8_9BACT|nr:chemotaxis protein CheW [Pontibacter ummariensis]PRY15392.1 purine-binding chemotaxis protein CheW [Pontibacter ummariensis]SNS16398.1 CheW protein [Pontibacter ummariensis]